MPPDPSRRLMLCTVGYASHTRIVHLYLMAMQFQKRPIKFTFDWPFRPSNNFPLYCTLTHIPTFCFKLYIKIPSCQLHSLFIIFSYPDSLTAVLSLHMNCFEYSFVREKYFLMPSFNSRFSGSLQSLVNIVYTIKKCVHTI